MRRKGLRECLFILFIQNLFIQNLVYLSIYLLSKYVLVALA